MKFFQVNLEGFSCIIQYLLKGSVKQKEIVIVLHPVAILGIRTANFLCLEFYKIGEDFISRADKELNAQSAGYLWASVPRKN